jgi:DNA-binding Xre family transcriptional regulator
MGRPQLEYDTIVGNMIKKRGWSTMDLTNEINRFYPHSPIAYSTVVKIVSGRLENYTIDTLIRLCTALSCYPNDIVQLEWEKEA